MDSKLKINQTSDYDGQWRVHHKIQVVDQVVGFLLQNLTYPIRQTKEAKSGRDLPNPTIFLPYPTISQQDLMRSHQKSFGLLGIYLSLQN